MAVFLGLFMASLFSSSSNAAAQENEREGLVVMPLKRSGVPKNVIGAMDDFLAVAVSRRGTYRVTTKEDLDAQMGREHLKDLLGCDAVACAAEIAGALDTRFLLAGSVRKLGSKIVVTLALIDTKDQTTKRGQAAVENNEDLFQDAIETAARQISFLGGASSEDLQGAHLEYPSLSGQVLKPTCEGVSFSKPCWLKASNQSWPAKNQKGCYVWESTPQVGRWLEYSGECLESRANGQGTMTKANGDSYMGQWREGRYHGQGTLTLAHGSKYIGQFQHGDRHGRGTEYSLGWRNRDDLVGYMYEGEWKHDKWSGKGVMTWRNGNKYVGHYERGYEHGFGTLTWSGNKYEGQFRYGVQEGHGTLTMPNGHKYVGDWRLGHMEGRGIYTKPNGGRYIGQFKYGRRHGFGIQVLFDGAQGSWTKREGFWVNGKYMGEQADTTEPTDEEILQFLEEAQSRDATCSGTGSKLSVMASGGVDCRVTVGGRNVGVTPLFKTEAPVGDCEIRVTCPDGKSYSKQETLRTGVAKKIIIKPRDWK